ncbi:hypothetical protein ACFWZY_17120 [Streptomyces sp. NPDC058992]|uniref:hypothetical protein n=1 Tax=Streptomyces sp. NPDC058992 TaxID=3346688 RepID=UPI0036BC80A8
METRKLTMTPPVHLGLPCREPAPAKGCGVCSALSKQRKEAREAGDLSKATDCSVEIQNHPHRKPRLS